MAAENKKLNSAGNFNAALSAWSDLIGAEFVHSSATSLAAMSQSTLPFVNTGEAILRPASQSEVAGVVKIASEFEIPLYPICTGKNWGYGDACPAEAGQVILDLSRLNKIIEVNADLAYVVIEPGVTQGQLSSYLRENNFELWCDATGAGPETSVIGNVMERGFGHTSYGNRSQNISALSVVMADGETLETGYAHYQNSRAKHIFPDGIGPSFNNIFTQSSFGIVTQLTMWLMPKPQALNTFICMLEEEQDLGALIEEMRDLKLNGVLDCVVHIGNDMRVIASKTSFPSDYFEKSRLTFEDRIKWRKLTRAGAWTAAGSFHGTKAEVAEKRKLLKKQLRKRNRELIFFDDFKLKLMQKLLTPIRKFIFGERLLRMLEVAKDLYKINCGIPVSSFLKGCYWRHKSGLPKDFGDQSDPAKDGCGLIWLSPVSPMTALDVAELINITTNVLSEYDHDPFITLSTLNERSIGAVISISYDKDNPEESERSMLCYNALLSALQEEGFYPYRMGVQSMDKLAVGSANFWNHVDSIKSALDPKGIISPGRYDPLRILRKKY